MAGVPAIRVNDEKNVVDHATNHLDSDLAIFTTIVQPLQCGTQEDPRGIFEVEAAFVKVAPAFGFRPTRGASSNVRFKRSALKSAGSRIARFKVPLILFTYRKFLERVDNDRVYRCEMALVARENH